MFICMFCTLPDYYNKKGHRLVPELENGRALVASLAAVAQDLGAALAARNLQDAIGDSGSNQLFILQSADVVERQAICDNLVCEAGERPSTANGANGGRIYVPPCVSASQSVSG